VGAIGLLGTGAAGIIGRGVTLSFVFAVVGVALVAYCFMQLSQHIAHTGSVYALVGVTLGPQAGFFAGWALMGAYIAIGCGSTIEIGLFGGQFLNDTFGLHIAQWWWISLIGLALVCTVAFSEIRVITRALLSSEVIGAILVTILSIVILVTLIVSHGPKGQTFNAHFLELPPGGGVGTIAKAAVYGFLAFAGFEGAAALGEETSSPKTEIPRAIKTAVGRHRARPGVDGRHDDRRGRRLGGRRVRGSVLARPRRGRRRSRGPDGDGRSPVFEIGHPAWAGGPGSRGRTARFGDAAGDRARRRGRAAPLLAGARRLGSAELRGRRAPGRGGQRRPHGRAEAVDRVSPRTRFATSRSCSGPR
jgi:hypothetical protein